MAAAASQHHPSDRRPAHQAGLGFPPIDTVLQLKESFFSIGVDVIGNRRAAKRNRFVASICDEVVIPYAAPESKTAALALELLAAGRCVYTFDSDASTSLSSHGAVVMSPELLSSHYKAGFREAVLTDAAYNKS